MDGAGYETLQAPELQKSTFVGKPKHKAKKPKATKPPAKPVKGGKWK